MAQSKKVSVKKEIPIRKTTLKNPEKVKWVTKRANKVNEGQDYKITDNYGIIQELEQNPTSDSVLSEVQNTTGMSLNQLAEFVYEMTPKTLASYKNSSKHLPSRSLEISIKLKNLYEKANQLFLKKEDFNSWLHEESIGLGGRVPVKLLNTSTGIDLVLEELIRIEFGATA